MISDTQIIFRKKRGTCFAVFRGSPYVANFNDFIQPASKHCLWRQNCLLKIPTYFNMF